MSKDVAMGAEKWVDMHSYYKKDNNSQDCRYIKSPGFQIVATNTQMMFFFRFDVIKSRLFGTERDGLSDIWIRQMFF